MKISVSGQLSRQKRQRWGSGRERREDGRRTCMWWVSEPYAQHGLIQPRQTSGSASVDDLLDVVQVEACMSDEMLCGICDPGIHPRASILNLIWLVVPERS